jgi:acetyl esterase/lipase
MAKCNANDPLFTPLNLTDFSRLGPIHYQIAGMDMWKDSALFYCGKVKEAGGSVKMDLYPGVPHVWYSMYPELSINKKWSKDLITGVGWLLTQKPESQVAPRL